MVPSLMIVSPDQLDHHALISLVLTWLEHLVLQLRHHLGDEGRVGVDEEGDGGDQGPAVVVDHVLSQPVRELAQDRLLVEELALVAVLEVLRDTVPCVRGKLPVGHVLLNLLRFLPADITIILDSAIKRHKSNTVCRIVKSTCIASLKNQGTV